MTRHIHIHVGNTRDASEAQVTWAQFMRKLKSGEWVYEGEPDPKKALFIVTVPEKKRGVHNYAGMSVRVSIVLSPAELQAEKNKEEAAALERIRLINERYKPKDALSNAELNRIKQNALKDIEYWERREGDKTLTDAERTLARENRLSAQRTLVKASEAMGK